MSGKPRDEEGFLTRWSRRKQASLQAEEVSDDTGLDPDAVAGLQEASHPEGGEGPSEDLELAANRAAAEAVDLESLTYESDFTVFMKRGVPEALKNAALRKLWRSNPDLAVLDGLNDYDTDFRTAETALEGFGSAWKVGRGYADKAEAVAAEMEARSAALENPENVGNAMACENDTGNGTGPEKAEAETAEDMKVRAADLPEAEPAAAPGAGNGELKSGEPVRKVSIRRRMAFDNNSL